MLSGTERQSGPDPSSPTPGPEGTPPQVPNPSERGEGSQKPPLPSETGEGVGGEGVLSGVGGEGLAVRGEDKRRLIAALLGIQLLLAAVALVVWVWTPDRPALPPVPARTAPIVGSGATYESAQPLAQAQADVWIADHDPRHGLADLLFPRAVGPAGAASRRRLPRRRRRAPDWDHRDPGDGGLGAGARLPPASATSGDRLDPGDLARRGGGGHGLPSRLPPVPTSFADVSGRGRSHRVAAALGGRLRRY